MTVKRKIKISLLLDDPGTLGGIQSSARRHLKLMRDDFDIVPICFDTSRKEADWGGRRERLQGLGGAAYNIIASDLKSDNSPVQGSSTEALRHDMRYRSFADQLVAIVEEEGIEMLNAWGLFHQRGLLAAFAAAKCGIPYLLSLRGSDLETRIFDEKSLPSLHASLAGAEAIVCVSRDSETLLRRLFRPACPTYVVRNSFDPSGFKRGPVALPLLAGGALPVIGCFGKFRRVTGLDYLLKAFALVNKRRPAVLLLVGSFESREVSYYNGLIDSLPCSANILRVGYVENARVLDYMGLCDVVAFPSISDASPNKVLEAMYAKVPLVASKVGGIPELVSHGEDALLVAPRAAEPLADAIEKLLSQPSLAKRLVASAYRKVTEELVPDQERPLWVEIYRKSHAGFADPRGEREDASRLPA